MIKSFLLVKLKRLGVGISLKQAKWPEELPRAVRIIERSKKRLKKAENISKWLENEDGSHAAVTALEALVMDSK